MEIDRFNLRYRYIFSIAIWLSIDTWNIYQFYTNINSSQDSKIVKSICHSISDNLFNIDIFFVMVCLILSIQIWKQKQTIIYFCYTYLIYTAITTFSLVILGDTLIHYEQQQGVWGGGTPMGQALYIGLLIVIGIISAFSYLSRQAVLWVIKKIRDRG